MAMAAGGGQSLQPGKVFKISGRQLIAFYLCRGKLSDAILPGGCSVAAGVDVFAASPHALPFHASHRGEHGEVWGYFAAARMADRIQPVPGGCWVMYGKEKPYVLKGETIGYRSRFAFYVTRVEGDGMVMWAQTRWQMKEYRLEKNATRFSCKKLEHPEANMDFVIRKVFAKPAVPLPPPVHGVGVRLPSSAAQPTKLPVKAGLFAVRKDSTKTKTKPRKVAPTPVPPYARSEGGEALQQGGSSLPPRSTRPPRPPKVVAKPVTPPPPPQIVTKPVAPPPTPQVIAKPVAPSPPPQVIAKLVAPPPPPQVIAKPVAPPPPSRVIAKPVVPPPPLQVIATPVAPPLSPQAIATAVVPPPLPARSSLDEATSSRAQPDKPNANMEIVVHRVPTGPLILPPPSPAQSAAARARWVFKIPSGRQIIAQYLVPKAIQGQLPRGVTPGFVAEGVDVFGVSPDALPFPPSHRKQNGEVWGYFFAAKPTSSMRLAHGGCWMQYGREKKYCMPREVVACHRRFAFHAARVDGAGTVAWEQTRWLMKEYRLNKAAPSARKVQTGPGANMDLVVLKVFTKPAVPRPPRPQPTAWSGNAEYPGSNYPSVNEGADCSRPVGPRPPPQPPASTFDLPDLYSR